VRVSLTRGADRELAAIVRWGAEHFGRATAIEYASGMFRLFDLLAGAPKMSTEVRGGVRAHSYRSHMIVYREHADELQILHIRHGRSNWRKYL
jgi:toxin ParE1/3/4